MVSKVKYISEILPAEFGGDTITYSLPPGCSDEEGAMASIEELFIHHNEFRNSIGKPSISYKEYLEWRKT